MFGDKEKEFWLDVTKGRLAERRSWIPSQLALSEVTGVPASTLSTTMRTLTERAPIASVVPVALVLDIDLYGLARGLELDEPVLKLLEDRSKCKYFTNYMKAHELTDEEDEEKAQAIKTLIRDLPPERQDMAAGMIETLLNQMK